MCYFLSLFVENLILYQNYIKCDSTKKFIRPYDKLLRNDSLHIFFTSVHPRITCVTLVHTCFKLGIRAICLLILLASSSLTSSGISTTGPRLLEQHLLSQLARGVLNWVEPMISRQQCSPSNRSCKTNRY